MMWGHVKDVKVKCVQLDHVHSMLLCLIIIHFGLDSAASV